MDNDLISRQQAIDALADMHCKSDEDGYVWIIRSDAWARIDALPSITPKQKRGKWNGYNADNPDWLRDDGSPVFLTCSECHGAVMNNGSAHWNFCPNCGARMKGNKE